MDQNTGTITVNTTGGTASYQFFLDGNLITTQASPNFVYPNVSGGSHTVSVTDGNGCSVSAPITVQTIQLTNVVIQGSCTNVVTITGNAAPGSTISVTGLPVVVPPVLTVSGNFDIVVTGVPFGIYNNVTVTATNPNTPNCSPFITETVVVGCPTLSLFLCCGGKISARQKSLTFAVTVKNTGESPAFGLTVQDALPSCFEFVSAQAVAGEAWTFSTSGQTVTAQLAELDSGDTASFTITVRVKCCRGQTVENTATVLSEGIEPFASSCVYRIE